MVNWKPGLQKKVSSIFDGVPVPGKNNQSQQTSIPQWKLDENNQRPNPLSVAPPARAAAPAQNRTLTSTAVVDAQIDQDQSYSAESEYENSTPRFWNQIQEKFLTIHPQIVDTKQKVMMGLIPVLVVVLFVVLINAFKTPQANSSRPASLVATADAFAGSSEKINWQIPASLSATIRDPMQIGSSSNTLSGATELLVKGIVYSNDKPSAVIGTQIVKEGEKVLGATIVNIKQDCVEFEQDGRKWTQRVQK